MNKSPEISQERASANPLIRPSLANYYHLPAAILLLVAAALKAHQLATSPLTANLVFESRLFTISLIGVEFLLAFWLVSDWNLKHVRPVAIGAFVIFLVSSLSKVATGSSSCGCFGVVEVPPIVSVMLDLFVISTLIYWPASSVFTMPRIWICALFIICISVTFYSVMSFETSALSSVGEVIGDGELVIVNTENWVGNRLPLTEFIDGEKNFLRGQWKLIVYHEDCPVCQHLINSALSGDETMRTVFVEIPPYKSPSREDRSDLIWRKLTDDHEWFVTAPEIVEMSDGKVTRTIGQ